MEPKAPTARLIKTPSSEGGTVSNGRLLVPTQPNMTSSVTNESPMPRYVLLTAVHNEESYIERTLNSVVLQQVKPSKWIIVNDRSTDQTGCIVRDFAARFNFIDVVEVHDGSAEMSFASKVRALRSGYRRLLGQDYDFIGILDGDVSFQTEYYAELINRLSRNPQLGLCGGFICESSGGEFRARRMNSTSSVAGAIQFFRRECYEGIGGLQPIPYGGEDWCAEVGARMAGWIVESFPDLKVFHHRATGTGAGLMHYWYRQGRMDYALGSLPSFEVVKCARRLVGNPGGALARWLGFVVSCVQGSPRAVSNEFVEYLRREQRHRLRSWIGWLPGASE